MGAKTWTNEQVEQLKRLWEVESCTAQNIADALGEGFTRGAVIGKAHRMGLKQAPKPPRVKSPRKRSRKKKPDIAPLNLHPRPLPHEPCLPPEPAHPVTALGCSIWQLTNETCRWPIGHPNRANFYFCGAPGAEFPERPYCAEHHAIAYSDAPGERPLRAWRD